MGNGRPPIRMTALLLLVLAMARTGQACLSNGVGQGCGCHGCPACVAPPPPPPVQCGCGGSVPSCAPCAGYNHDEPSAQMPRLLPHYGPAPSYVPPPPPPADDNSVVAESNDQRYPTANNNLPHIPSSPQFFAQSDGNAYALSHSAEQKPRVEMSLEQAVQFYNRDHNDNIKVPPSPPMKLPGPDFKGLPSIQYAAHSPAPPGAAPPEYVSEAKALPPTSTSSTTTTHHARLHAADTFMAHESEADGPSAEYALFEAQVCAGITLGRSTEPDSHSATERCAQIGCAAANLRLLATGQYEVIYLKTADLRKESRSYDCVSALNVPLWTDGGSEKRLDLEKQLKLRDQYAHMNGLQALRPSRIRPTTVEPKGRY